MFKIELEAEPFNKEVYFSGFAEIADTQYNFVLTHNYNGTFEVEFMDEEAIETELFEYEIKELREAIINKYKLEINNYRDDIRT
jgi:hypothetical protein